MKNVETITLGTQHSMMSGYVPQKVKEPAKLGWGKNVDVGKFGLFETSTPNYTTFYPDVTPEEFTPKDEDFITPVFRMLSMTTVHSGWNPISFKKEGVLRNSMEKLIGQSVNIDHETALGNAIGTVADVWWQDSYETVHNGKQVTVPAGINARLKIDAKSNPRIARGILMEPPSIHSNSVTVSFAWEKSHPELTDEEFRENLGSFDDKGVRVEKVANDIRFYAETSLVAHGADPFAQLVNDKGQLNNPSFAGTLSASARFNNLVEQGERPDIFFDFKNTETVSNSTTPLRLNNNNFNNSKLAFMKKQILALAALFSLSVDENITDEQLGSVVDQVSDSAKELLGLKDQVTSLTDAKGNLETQLGEKDTEIENLKAEVAEFKPDAETGIKALKDVRAEAVRLYKVLKGDDAQESIISNHEACTYDEAQGFIVNYETELEEKLKSGQGADGSQSDNETPGYEELKETFMAK